MKRILCFGDSNTWGLVAGTSMRYPQNKRWTGILQNRIGFKTAQIIEEGLCGRTTAYEDKNRPGRNGEAVLADILQANLPLDIVILMLGTNDCKTCYHATADEIGGNITRLLDIIVTHSPDSRIVLISPICLGDGVGDSGFDMEFNDNSVMVSKQLKSVYQEIARWHHLTFIAAEDYASPCETDREHLGETGHSALAEAIYHELQRIMYKDER